MMKQKTASRLNAEKVNIVDGPPLDFSFKNIRNLQGTSFFIQSW